MPCCDTRRCESDLTMLSMRAAIDEAASAHVYCTCTAQVASRMDMHTDSALVQDASVTLGAQCTCVLRCNRVMIIVNRHSDLASTLIRCIHIGYRKVYFEHTPLSVTRHATDSIPVIPVAPICVLRIESDIDRMDVTCLDP